MEREKKVPLKELFKNGDSFTFKPLDLKSPDVIAEIKKVRREQKKIMDSLIPKPSANRNILFK